MQKQEPVWGPNLDKSERWPITLPMLNRTVRMMQNLLKNEKRFTMIAVAGVVNVVVCAVNVSKKTLILFFFTPFCLFTPSVFLVTEIISR